MVGLYINNQSVPYSGEIVPRITKRSYDINNVNALWSDYTKTVQIPATNEVNILFGYLFNVNIDIQNTTTTNFNPDFNPNLKAAARIDVNDISYIAGYCQLTSIVRSDFNVIAYNITIYGTVSNLLNILGGSKLTDIDFSDLNHTWNYTNVQASWTPTIGTGYVYPMIDYGLSPTYDLWNVSQFFPAIFAKEYVDRIFSDAGFTYSSDFFDSDFFKSLIVPYTSEKLTLDDTTIADRIFFVERITSAMSGSITTTPNTISSYDTLIFNDDTGTNFNTSTSAYNTGTGVWSIDVNGRYSFRGEMEVTLTRTNSNFTAQSKVAGEGNIRFKAAVVKFDGSDYTVLETITTQWEGFSNGVVTPTTSTTAHTFSFSTNQHELKSGEDVYLAVFGVERFSIYYMNWLFDYNFDYSIATGAKFTINLDSQLVVGDTISMDATVPQDITQTDFLMGLFKCFNLFVEVDADNPNNLFIEPYDDFFTGSEDLTTYLDTSKDFEIKPMAMLNAKRYQFNYTEDKDYLNQKYLQSFEETYGTKKKDIINDFLKNTYEIKPVFAATPSSASKTNDRVLPDIKFVDQNGVIKSGKANIRLLYWGGLKDTAKSWQIYQTLPTTYTQTQYPYAGHLDDPYSPTLDLSFGVPKGVYWSAQFGSTLDQSYTDNNLYNKYWSRYIYELTDKNSKIVSCYMNLSFKFMDLSFRKQYYIKDAYYRLLEVQDHAVDGKETTKCVFLKVDNSPAFSPTTSTWHGGNKTFPSDENYPDILVDRFKGGSSINPSNGVVLGGGNTNGGGILVGDDHKGALVFKNVNTFGGNRNIVGADNVTMIGTSDYYVYREGETIINGLSAWSKLDYQLTGTEAASLNTTPIEILPALDTNEYYELEKMLVAVDFNEAWTITTPVLSVQTTTSGSILNSISNLYSQAADAYLKGTVGTEALDFGEGLTVTSSADAGAGTTNVVRIILYYRINRI